MGKATHATHSQLIRFSVQIHVNFEIFKFLLNCSLSITNNLSAVQIPQKPEKI